MVFHPKRILTLVLCSSGLDYHSYRERERERDRERRRERDRERDREREYGILGPQKDEAA